MANFLPGDVYNPQGPDQPFDDQDMGPFARPLPPRQQQRTGPNGEPLYSVNGDDGGFQTPESDIPPPPPSQDPTPTPAPEEPGPGRTKRQPVPKSPDGGVGAGAFNDIKDAPASSTGPDYGALEALLTKMLAGQAADRDAVAKQREGLQSTLNRLITSAERPVSATDAEIAGPVTAFNAQGQRARRLLQEQLAQQATASGRTTGSVDAEVEKSFENLGNATGTYEGGLMTNELKSRRDQLMSALTLSEQLGNSAEASRLQEELNAINGQIAMQGGKAQNQQFYDKLTSDMGTQTNSLDEILALLLSGGGRGSLAA